jgi:hypothetical protein
MTATISIVVPELTDNAIWFANAASWSNYWAGISGTVEFDAIATAGYTSAPYNAALQPAQITIDADVFLLATNAMFTSLKQEIQTLNSSYAALRAELYTAGFITTP